MFIYSVRASTVKFFAFVILTLALVVGAVSLGEEQAVLASGAGTEIDYSGIKTREDRVAFIGRFGVRVDADSEESCPFTMPESFDRVIVGYNELQKRQGLDLSKYAGKRVTRYTYEVENYKSEEQVLVNLFVYRGKVVACDISTADPEGFVLPLTQVEGTMLK